VPHPLLEDIARRYAFTETDVRRLAALVLGGAHISRLEPTEIAPSDALQPSGAFSRPGQTLLAPESELFAPGGVSVARWCPASGDRYTLLSRLGQGPTSEVWRVSDRELMRSLAMKTVSPERAGEANIVARFVREAKVTAQLQHPGVVPVHDLGLLPDGRPFFTMQELLGEPLSRVLTERRAAWTLRRLLAVLRAVCDAVGYAHSCGVVHGELVAENILVGDFGQVSVLDWGRASLDRDGRADDVASLLLLLEQIISAGGARRRVPESVARLRSARTAPTLSAALSGWLDGAERSEEAMAVLAQATAVTWEVQRVRTEAAQTWVSADAALAEGDERLGFERWAASRALERQAAVLELDHEQHLYGALVHRPELPQAHLGLARIQRARLAEATASGDRLGRERAQRRLSVHLAMLSASDRADLVAEAPAVAAAERLVGRRRLQARVRRRLQGAGSLVSLVGPAGVGKTRLAIALAAGAPSVMCALDALRTPDDLPRAVALALRVPLEPGDPRGQIAGALRGRGPLLLVLDALRLAPESIAPIVEDWLDRAPDLRVLITRRGGSGPGVALEVGPLSPLAALELFELRGQQARPGFALTAERRAVALDLTERLGRVPQAIELAAARLGQISLVELAARFGAIRAAPAVEHSALDGALEWSWGLLSDWSRRALAQCSVFCGGFTLAAAEAVVDLSPWPSAPDVLDVLASLCDDRLLDVQAGARYRMSAVVRELATHRLHADAGLVGAPGVDPTRRCHAAHYARFGSDPFLTGLDLPGGERAALGRELENLVAGARDGEPDDAGRCALAVMAHVQVRGPARLGLSVAVAPLSRRDLSPRIRARLLAMRAALCGQCGDAPSALTAAQQALELHRLAADRRGAARVRCTLSALSARQGDDAAALAQGTAALALLRELGDRAQEGVLLGNLATLLLRLGRLPEARLRYGEALSAHREVGNRRFEGIVLGHMGVLLRRAGQPDAAASCFERALRVHRQVGDRRSQGHVLGWLAGVHKHQGRLEHSVDCYRRALRLHRMLGDVRAESVALSNLGSVYLMSGDLDAARECSAEALTLHRIRGDRRSEGIALANLGALRFREGSVEAAVERYREALDVFLASGDLRSAESVRKSMQVLEVGTSG